jgi:sugar O-acyltransferase (sialic acid O-acetyltransferase NeuD family)
MQKIVIAGNTLSAEILLSYLRQDSRYQVVAFTVDRSFVTNSTLRDLPVVPIDELSSRYSPKENVRILMGIGYSDLNRVRQKLFLNLKELGYAFETYIHPTAHIFNDGVIGEGSVILANTVVEPYSTIGANSVVWANCTVGHHSSVGDNCWVASGTVIAGEAKVKNNSFLGVNVTIANKVIVEELNVIGGSTFISKDTKANEVWLSRQGEKHRFDAENYSKFFLK